MAYIFDPIRNTFIDDEDKSLGNKLALNDEEIDKVIKQIDDKFGPGTVVPASELPSKEDPYKDFMDRNPMADASNDEGYLDSRLDEMLKAYQDYLSSAGGSKKVIPLNVFASTYAKENFKDGGMIGGGVIQGEDYGDRSGFATPKLIQGGSRTPVQFRGKYGVRSMLEIPADTPGYLGRSGEQLVFETKSDATRFIKQDLDNLVSLGKLQKEKRPEIIETAEKINEYVNNLIKQGNKKIYLNDIIDEFDTSFILNFVKVLY